MTDEQQKKLIEKYPSVFRKKADKIEPFSMFGMECGSGWYDILDRLLRCINNHLDWFNRNKQEEDQLYFVVTQIKEKYGVLRFYYSGGDDYIDGLIDMAMSMSSVICETCGNSGKIRGERWIYIACEEHTHEEDKE